MFWNYNKPVHFKKDFRLRKVKKDVGRSRSKDLEKQQGHNSDLVQNSNYVQNSVFVISDAFCMKDDDVAWWVNFGATSYVCKDLCCF